MLTNCSIYSSKSSNLFYSNLHRTSENKYKQTKQLYSYDYTENNYRYFTENGYVMIGYDAIRHTYIGHQEAINAGCWLGATVLLYKHTFIGTAKGSAVVPLYNPGETYLVTSRTSGNINVHGNSNAQIYSNNSSAYITSQSQSWGSYNSNTSTTIKTPGSFSYYSVPYSRDYYDQYAVFMVKKYYRSERNLPLLQKANTNSKVLAAILVNEWFEVISLGDKFIKVKYKTMIGFIDSSHPLM